MAGPPARMRDVIQAVARQSTWGPSQRCSSKVKVTQTATVGDGIQAETTQVSACYIERAQRCYGRPNYAMTLSYQWTAFNAYLIQN